MSDSRMRLEPGDEFAGHRVEAQCREGGMAQLYRVRAPDGSPCILKLPRTGIGSHSACLSGFETEREILRRLKGTVAPRLYASGEIEGLPWLICEDLGADSLAARVSESPLPEAEVARLGRAVALALAALHRQEVVHHDLKPDHVMFRRDGNAALIDYGLARHAAFPDFVADQIDDRRSMLGTPAYVSPEQAAGRRGDPRSDLFSLGVILYRLITGALPFGEPSSRVMIGVRRYLDCVPPRNLNPDCSAALQEIILHCLEPDPGDRYGSAAQLAGDLQHPAQVSIGERGERRHRRIVFALRGFFAAALSGASLAQSDAGLPAAAPDAPQILVALDVAHGQAAQAHALRAAVGWLAAASAQSRVICAYALAGAGAAAMEDADGLREGLRSEGLMALHHWAAPLGLPPERLRFVVLAEDDAAQALLDYIEAHHIDHVVVGARGHSTLRRVIGSVSARLAAEAPCSVSVIRQA